MTRLDRLVLMEVVGPFFGSALLFTGLVFAGGELIRYAEYLQKGESVVLVAQLMLLTIPSVMALTFPMAMLLAALLGYGRLSGDSEIIALTAGGASFERVALPCAVFALLVSSVGLWFSNQVVPASSRARNEIIDGIRTKGTGIVTGSRLTVPLLDDKGELSTLIHVEGPADLANGVLQQVSIEFWHEGRPTSFLYAPRAHWNGKKDWTVENFTSINWADPERPIFFRAPEGATKEVTLDKPDQLPALIGRPEDISTTELRAKSRILRAGGNTSSAREAEVEIGRRNALPLASLAFGLIGAPLGVRPQRGGRGVGFGLSVIITFLYWIGLQVVSVIARGGTLPADFALQLPNLICAGLGLFLIRRVMR